MLIHDDSAAGVMRGGHYRYALSRNIDSQCQATFMGLRKVTRDKTGGPVTDVKINTICAQSLHFMINIPRDNIPWREFGPGVEVWHEPFAALEVQRSAFAP
jgi:hypothetical protein